MVESEVCVCVVFSVAAGVPEAQRAHQTSNREQGAPARERDPAYTITRLLQRYTHTHSIEIVLLTQYPSSRFIVCVKWLSSCWMWCDGWSFVYLGGNGAGRTRHEKKKNLFSSSSSYLTVWDLQYLSCDTPSLLCRRASCWFRWPMPRCSRGENRPFGRQEPSWGGEQHSLGQTAAHEGKAHTHTARFQEDCGRDSCTHTFCKSTLGIH